MRTINILLILILAFAFSWKKPSSKSMEHPELKSIFEANRLTGSILIYDGNSQIYHGYDLKRSAQGFLPASTFKIANTLIGLESGVLADTNAIFYWKGEKRRLAIWEQDLSLKQAFHFSCVPCYQELARKIGVTRMREYLNKFEYGNMKFDSTTIDLFWLEGKSKISLFGQIDFLRKIVEEKLPASQSNLAKLKELMIVEKTDRYTISGKTGWAIREGNNYGWFVGYMNTKGKVIYFATNVEPLPGFNQDEFMAARKNLTYDVLRKLQFMP